MPESKAFPIIYCACELRMPLVHRTEDCRCAACTPGQGATSVTPEKITGRASTAVQVFTLHFLNHRAKLFMSLIHCSNILLPRDVGAVVSENKINRQSEIPHPTTVHLLLQSYYVWNLLHRQQSMRLYQASAITALIQPPNSIFSEFQNAVIEAAREWGYVSYRPL